MQIQCQIRLLVNEKFDWLFQRQIDQIFHLKNEFTVQMHDLTVSSALAFSVKVAEKSIV
jgi:hypothetical protein